MRGGSVVCAPRGSELGMKVSLALFAIPLFVRSLSAQSVGRAGPIELAITHVTVIDVSSGVSNPDMTVEVAGNRIRAVRKSSRPALPGYAHIINGRGRMFVNARKAEQDVRKGGQVGTSELNSCSYEAA